MMVNADALNVGKIGEVTMLADRANGGAVRRHLRDNAHPLRDSSILAASESSDQMIAVEVIRPAVDQDAIEAGTSM